MLPRPRAGPLELVPERIETGTAKFDLTLTLSDFNADVEVEAPPADEVTEGGEGLPF